MKKLLLASAMFLTTFSSQAARVQFDFDVYSSGASIYPCNAGLKHKKHRGVFCYNPDTFKSCNPDGGDSPGFMADLLAEGGRGHDRGQDNCNPDTGEGCDCVCAGDLDGRNENSLDTVRGKVTRWRDHGDMTPGGGATIEKTAGEHDYHSLVSGSDQFNARLKELSFNLGSELYGAKYFVDICFRATQIDYGQDPNYIADKAQEKSLSFALPEETVDNYVQMPEFGSIDNPLYKFERRLTVTDLAGSNTSNEWDLGEDDTIWSEESYQSAARLYVQSGIYCKDKDNQFVQVYGFSGNPSLPINLSNAQDFEFFDRYAAADLKGCVVRYSFEEKARYAHKNKDKFRRWKMQGANICTDTAITNVQGHDHDIDPL